MIEVYGIPSTHLTPGLWTATEPFIAKSCEGSGTEDSSDVRKWIDERTVQLWAITDEDAVIGAAITEIHSYPKMQICTVRHYGGKMSRGIYARLSGVVSHWAKVQGCSRLELLGRPGWERLAGEKVSRSFFVLQSDLTGE